MAAQPDDIDRDEPPRTTVTAEAAETLALLVHTWGGRWEMTASQIAEHLRRIADRLEQ